VVELPEASVLDDTAEIKIALGTLVVLGRDWNGVASSAAGNDASTLALGTGCFSWAAVSIVSPPIKATNASKPELARIGGIRMESPPRRTVCHGRRIWLNRSDYKDE
jgi:hypothetical protein